jgi:hypothetical protein
MAGVLRENGIDREIEYSFEIKLLGSPLQASAFLAHLALGARHCEPESRGTLLIRTQSLRQKSGGQAAARMLGGQHMKK